MKYKSYTNIKTFYNDVISFLSINEAFNNLPIGIIKRGRDDVDTSDWLLATVSDTCENLILVVIQTPPHNIILTANIPIGDDILRFLCDNLISNNICLPGVVCDKLLAEAFALVYIEAFKNNSLSNNAPIQSSYLFMDEIQYSATNVNPIKTTGKMREANQSDMFYIPYWVKSMEEDIFSNQISLQNAYSVADNKVSTNRLYLLIDNNMPVAMAAIMSETLLGCRVGLVYTPPFFRNKGYATSLVYMLTKKHLNLGLKYCALFADKNNLVSNHIYQKIGYTPIGDYAEIKFK